MLAYLYSRPLDSERASLSLKIAKYNTLTLSVTYTKVSNTYISTYLPRPVNVYWLGGLGTIEGPGILHI